MVLEAEQVGIGEVKPFSNSTYGFDMNQNGGFGGTPEGIHDGTDSTKWTASAVNGNWTFNSTAQAHTGTKSIDATQTNRNQSALFEDATSTDMTNYTALSGWIYITSWVERDSNVQFQARLNGVNVGTAKNVSDYINTGTFNAWQKFAIPKADLGLTTNTIDELLITTIGSSGNPAPNYYLDDIQWEQTGGSISFEITPTANTLYYVYNLIFVGVSTFDPTTTNPLNVQNLSYDKFFGETKLASGLVTTTTVDNTTTFAGVFTRNADFMLVPYTDISSGSDGTSTWYRYQTRFDKPIRLDSDTSDNLRFIVNDDLSGMEFFRIYSNGVTRA